MINGTRPSRVGTDPSTAWGTRATIIAVAVGVGVLAALLILGISSPPCVHSCPEESGAHPVPCPAPATGCPSDFSSHLAAAIIVGTVVALGVGFVGMVLSRPLPSRDV